MADPLISVILATYNGSKFISEAINSVLKQTYREFELIIVDDASVDDVGGVMATFCDSRIKFNKNKEKIFLTKSLNWAIKMCSGKYIARIDDDDVWVDNEKLAKQVSFMENNKDVGLLGAQAMVINENGQSLFQLNYPLTDELLRKFMLLRNQFVHSSVMLRVAAINKVGSYDERIKYGQDYEMWLRIGRQYKLANLPDVEVFLRRSSHTISNYNHFAQLKSLITTAYQYRSEYPNYRRYVPAHFKECVINVFPRKYTQKMMDFKRDMVAKRHFPF
jgi:glycosyltransferase involved in cell wall biosynthesis